MVPLRGIGPANTFGHARLGSSSGVVEVRPHFGKGRLTYAASDIGFPWEIAALAKIFDGRSACGKQLWPAD
jgi:hypothetical protein